MTTLTLQTARRYILGKQGLWPGRRWRGYEGVVQAMNECEEIQLDPLCVIARNHDLTLMSRVLDYDPEFPMRAAYQERQFFDYGGTLFFFPMEDLPYWRLAMEARRGAPRYQKFVQDHPGMLEATLEMVRERGPLGNRDVVGSKVTHYRGGKDVSVALFYLWITGAIMTHSRRRFERVYDLTERVAPAEYQWVASGEEAERYFARNLVGFLGLARSDRLYMNIGYWNPTQLAKDKAQKIRCEMLESGGFAEVAVEGWKGAWLLLGEDLPLIDCLAAGKVPAQWKPQETTNEEEVLFLAPLEIVSARGRAKQLFDFDYIWEVYKPLEKRKWGYYTLPILWGDKLVARMDSRLDRPTSTLQVLGFWLEDEGLSSNADFVAALRKGLNRFAQDHRAKLDASAIPFL